MGIGHIQHHKSLPHYDFKSLI